MDIFCCPFNFGWFPTTTMEEEFSICAKERRKYLTIIC
jgi:hypothetical protein